MNQKRKSIALTIWWCEGTKKRRDKRWKNAYLSPIEVTNTDSRIIRLFIDFLRKDLKVSSKKLHARVQIHEDNNQKEIEMYWSKATDIPLSQFNKTIVRKKGNKVGKNLGTFTLRTYDKALYQKMTVLLEQELREVIAGV